LASERGKLIAWIVDERSQLMKPVNPDTMNVFPADTDTPTVSSCETKRFMFFCCPGHFLANDLHCGDWNHDDFTPSQPNHNVPTPISATMNASHCK
jgi:hypothetical protein